MSEYQYYEFQAIDRPLTKTEMQELRSYSSRATITAAQFVNHYNWGDFKGDPSLWMDKYFDAHLYLANWGTHELMIRLPRKVLELETAEQYCCGQAASTRRKGDFIILEFRSEEGEDDWEDDGSGRLSSLIPLRSDLAAGDLRALYLAWLLCAQTGELEDDAAEPPVPAGLGELTGPLQAFADFLRIDSDLIAVAATRSPKLEASSGDEEVEPWIAALPDAEKIDWLARLARGQEPHLRIELLQQFRKSRPSIVPSHREDPRIVDELLVAAEQIAAKRRQKEFERAAAESARRDREAAEARERYLMDLADREPAAWLRVDTLIATKQPGKYDEAVRLLRDLRDLGIRNGRGGEVDAHLLRLCQTHAKKPSLLARMRKAGLL